MARSRRRGGRHSVVSFGCRVFPSHGVPTVGCGDVDLGHVDDPGARALADVLGAVPFVGDDEQRRPVWSAKGHGEGRTVEFDPLENLAALGQPGRPALCGTPQGTVGVEADAIGAAVMPTSERGRPPGLAHRGRAAVGRGRGVCLVVPSQPETKASVAVWHLRRVLNPILGRHGARTWIQSPVPLG